MSLLEFVDSEQGLAAITEGVNQALKDIRADLPSARLGGTELAYDLGIKHVITGLVRENLTRGHITCETPDPEGGAYDYYEIAGQKQNVSLRTNVSVREAKRRGLLRSDDVQWIGSAVVFLDADGDYILVVSCSGLSDLADEAAAESIAASVKRRLLRTYQYALAA